ncbi:hypothetical protein FRB99_008908 [Tulasnella sp. 403]|nr:hypothetical protein FRB99_008908 [Tulasnella sp. 403]
MPDQLIPEASFRKAIPMIRVADPIASVKWYMTNLGFHFGGPGATPDAIQGFASVHRGTRSDVNIYLLKGCLENDPLRDQRAEIMIMLDSPDGEDDRACTTVKTLFEEVEKNASVEIVDKLERKVWAYWQFTVKDPDDPANPEMYYSHSRAQTIPTHTSYSRARSAPQPPPQISYIPAPAPVPTSRPRILVNQPPQYPPQRTVRYSAHPQYIYTQPTQQPSWDTRRHSRYFTNGTGGIPTEPSRHTEHTHTTVDAYSHGASGRGGTGNHHFAPHAEPAARSSRRRRASEHTNPTAPVASSAYYNAPQPMTDGYGVADNYSPVSPKTSEPPEPRYGKLNFMGQRMKNVLTRRPHQERPSY